MNATAWTGFILVGLGLGIMRTTRWRRYGSLLDSRLLVRFAIAFAVLAVGIWAFVSGLSQDPRFALR